MTKTAKQRKTKPILMKFTEDEFKLIDEYARIKKWSPTFTARELVIEKLQELRQTA